jgi:hypothetical protein
MFVSIPNNVAVQRSPQSPGVGNPDLVGRSLNRRPQTVDWDRLARDRWALFPCRQRTTDPEVEAADG